MRNMRLKLFVALLACAMTWMARVPGAAFAEMGDYVLKDGKIYRVDGSKETLLEDDEPQSAGTEAGYYAWILVDPELSDGMKGSKPGIYFFFGDDEKPLAFLPMEQAGACMLEFSESGEKVLISRGTEAWQDLMLYFIEDGKFIKKKSFISMSHSFWIDPHRFIFTSVDKSKGTRTKGGDDWWGSPSLYDTVFEELTVLKEPTETKDYIITGCDHDKGTLDVTEATVKDKKDWNDPDKIEYKELTIPIPAAG